MTKSTPLVIVNARLPGYPGLQTVQISQQGIIERILSGEQLHPFASNPVDIEGDWLSLGGVDLQINGALGLAFPDLAEHHTEQLTTIAQFLWQQGVDGFLPTIVTTSVENIQRSLAVIANFKAKPGSTHAAQILGVHLEGPFLNPAKRGAHPEAYLLPLTVEQVKRVLGDYAELVTVMTLAPELDETGDAIGYLRSLGITVSLGHSLATAEQAQTAFQQGAVMVTHAFNAMPSLHHRDPGLLGAAIIAPTVYCGLIADGRHVSPLMMELVLRASHYEQGIFLVSDALAPLGLPDGTYPWDSRQITVTHGTAQLSDGTLAGTTLPLLAGAKNLVKWGICSVETAIALVTTAPRHAIGLPSEFIGQEADLLRWHVDPATQALTWQRFTTDGANFHTTAVPNG